MVNLVLFIVLLIMNLKKIMMLLLVLNLSRILIGNTKVLNELRMWFEFNSIITKIQRKNIKLQVWDTVGQENLRSMIRVFYKGSHAAFLVFDITKKDTFNKLDNWITHVKENELPEVRIILLGNRKDEEENREVSVDDTRDFVEKQQLLGYYETFINTKLQQRQEKL